MKIQTGRQNSEAKIRRTSLLPLMGGEVAARVLTFDGLTDRLEHMALQFGSISPKTAPLVRLHSECLTGDVFASQRCDCGPQLREALSYLGRNGGILLYLRQEGRGIGLYAKIDAYELQESGLDTYEANRKLSFADDLRDYQCAAEMLMAMGISDIRLLTNNPDKVAQLQRYGVRVVERIATGVYLNPHNLSYLQAKARHSKHDIEIPD